MIDGGTLDKIRTVTDIGAPIIGAVSSIVARLIEGSLAVSQAKAELRGVLSVAMTRLDAFDEESRARDRAEDERVRELAKSEPTKP